MPGLNLRGQTFRTGTNGVSVVFIFSLDHRVSVCSIYLLSEHSYWSASPCFTYESIAILVFGALRYTYELGPGSRMIWDGNGRLMTQT